MDDDRTPREDDETVDIHALIAEGLTRRQADYWTKRGYLHDVERGEGYGSGVPRRWPADEVQVARATLRLCRAGLHVEFAAKIARHHRTSGTLSFRLDDAAVLVISPDLWAPTPDPRMLPYPGLM